MNIILATYSYYPYNWGGTEVYVSGLAAILKSHGHHVIVIAGMPSQAFSDHPIFFEDEHMQTVYYHHRDIPIVGVVVKNENTREVYRKYRGQWDASWQNVLQLLPYHSWDILHLHAHTSAIGTALIKAVLQKTPTAKILATYHVPLSCPKGTLLVANKLKACNIAVSASVCNACVYSEKLGANLMPLQSLLALMPEFKTANWPTALRLKFLINEFKISFTELNGLVNRWQVFSHQIQHVLLLNKVNPNFIKLIKHGVNDYFFQTEEMGLKDQRKNEPIVFLFPSRFEKVKGTETLLKAWTMLPQINSRELWILADKTSASKQGNILERADIKWIGAKSQTELAQLMKQTHCTLIPSEWVEIGPLVFHEAIAAGSNIIASNLGGCAELSIQYPNVCTLFEAGNANALAKAIEHFLFKKIYNKPLNNKQAFDMVLEDYTTLVAADV